MTSFLTGNNNLPHLTENNYNIKTKIIDHSEEELIKYDYDLLLIADLLPNMVGFIPESSFAKVAYVNPTTDKIASQMQEQIIVNKTQNTSVATIHAVQYKEIARHFVINILNKNQYIKRIAKITYNSFNRFN